MAGEMKNFHLQALEALGGVRALFTGRKGGVSVRWQGGLNWSYAVGDDLADVRENRRRSLEEIGLPVTAAIMAGLVHGDRVVAVQSVADGLTDWAPDQPGEGVDVRMIPDCDALITAVPGLALVVTAADCVPIYLYDPVRRVIGAAHAGWRGTVAGIAGKTVQAMVAHYGSDPAQIHGVVGPSIGPCCYEVDDAVAEPIRQQYGAQRAAQLLLPGKSAGKYQLDLWSANRLDLERAGLHHLAIAGACTACGVDRLFSHRAESGAAGRGAAVIALT